MATIYDIAKRAGVSVATVSKVLNGYKDVSAKTRERIEQITAEMGYRPSAAARGLTTKHSMSIGVFFEDHVNSGFRHPFFHDVIASFKDVVGAEGYDLMFFSNRELSSSNRSLLGKARYRDVDGLLLLGVPRIDPGLVELSQSTMPCVSVDLDLIGPRAGYLCSDNVGGAVMAVEFLLQNGHQRIAFVGDMFATKPGHDRMLGYQQVMQRHQLPFRSEWAVEGDFTEQGGYTATKKLIALDERPTAIFCAGDMMAIGAMPALREAGLQPGVDISLIGFDDITLARYVYPGLTTIRQNREEMGRLAAMELLGLLRDDEKLPQVLTVDVELVVRDSVAPPVYLPTT